MKLTRRGLFGAVACAIVAPFAPMPRIGPGIRGVVLDAPTFGTMGSIERATFPFWRNTGNHSHLVMTSEAMMKAYNDCTRGV